MLECNRIRLVLLGLGIAGLSAHSFAILGETETSIVADDHNGSVPAATLQGKLEREEPAITIPRDFRSSYPFVARFAEMRAINDSAHVIDLAAVRFVTDDLVESPKKSAFPYYAPPVSTFASDLIRTPFETSAKDFFIVQAVDPSAQVRLRAYLEARGVPILAYIPNQAYLVRAEAKELESLATLSEIHWIGFHQPAWRIDPKLDYVIENAPTHELTILANFDVNSYLTQDELRQALASGAMDLLEITSVSDGWLAKLQGPALHAQQVALLGGVRWIERFVQPSLLNNVARSSNENHLTGRGDMVGPIMDIEDVWRRGLRGENQIIAVADTGLSTGNLQTLHEDFGEAGSSTNPLRVIGHEELGRAGRWDDDGAQCGGHGTHVVGSAVGNGFLSGASPESNDFPSVSYAGTAPKAELYVQSVLSGCTDDGRADLEGLPNDLNALFQTAYDKGARIHSNSWGSDVGGSYTEYARNLDRFNWVHKDLLIVVAAGNDGKDGLRWNDFWGICDTASSTTDGVIDPDSINSPGTAKNALTIGAAENERLDFAWEGPAGDCEGNGFDQQAWGSVASWCYSAGPIYSDLMADNASGMAAFSSRGPTDDARIKPDLVAPGVGIISTKTDLNPRSGFPGDCNVPEALRNYYETMLGTSMATPLVSGAAALTRQYFVEGWHANGGLITNTSPVAVAGFNPSAALVKATLLNGAWDMSPGQYGSGPSREIPPYWDSSSVRKLPNQVEGFGRVDLEHSLFPGSGWGDDLDRRMAVHDVGPGLVTGEAQKYEFSVTSDANPLVITLAWTDPDGAMSAGPKLVNNLDLRVVSPTGITYFQCCPKQPGSHRVTGLESAT